MSYWIMDCLPCIQSMKSQTQSSGVYPQPVTTSRTLYNSTDKSESVRDKDPHEVLSNHPSGEKPISRNLVGRLPKGLNLLSGKGVRKWTSETCQPCQDLCPPCDIDIVGIESSVCFVPICKRVPSLTGYSVLRWLNSMEATGHLVLWSQT